MDFFGLKNQSRGHVLSYMSLNEPPVVIFVVIRSLTALSIVLCKQNFQKKEKIDNSYLNRLYLLFNLYSNV